MVNFGPELNHANLNQSYFECVTKTCETLLSHLTQKYSHGNPKWQSKRVYEMVNQSLQETIRNNDF